MASSTVTCFDIVVFLVTITSIYSGIFVLLWTQNWANSVAASAKLSLAQKGVHVCSRGVSMKVPQYDQEEYINLHRRLGFQFACRALAKYPNHRVTLPLSQSSCSVQ